MKLDEFLGQECKSGWDIIAAILENARYNGPLLILDVRKENVTKVIPSASWLSCWHEQNYSLWLASRLHAYLNHYQLNNVLLMYEDGQDVYCHLYGNKHFLMLIQKEIGGGLKTLNVDKVCYKKAVKQLEGDYYTVLSGYRSSHTDEIVVYDDHFTRPCLAKGSLDIFAPAYPFGRINSGIRDIDGTFYACAWGNQYTGNFLVRPVKAIECYLPRLVYSVMDKLAKEDNPAYPKICYRKNLDKFKKGTAELSNIAAKSRNRYWHEKFPVAEWEVFKVLHYNSFA